MSPRYLGVARALEGMPEKFSEAVVNARNWQKFGVAANLPVAVI